MSIVFRNIEIKPPLFPRKLIKEILQRIAKDNNFIINRLEYTFCNDDFLSQINQKFLNHNTLTDIITFGYAEEPFIEGEIYISIDRIKDNSLRYNVPFQKELFRVIIHGLLHLCGYDDKKKQHKEIMQQKEEFYLVFTGN